MKNRLRRDMNDHEEFIQCSLQLTYQSATLNTHVKKLYTFTVEAEVGHVTPILANGPEPLNCDYISNCCISYGYKNNIKKQESPESNVQAEGIIVDSRDEEYPNTSII